MAVGHIVFAFDTVRVCAVCVGLCRVEIMYESGRLLTVVPVRLIERCEVTIDGKGTINVGIFGVELRLIEVVGVRHVGAVNS